MPLTPEEISELTQISWDIRKTIIETTFTCGGSHIGGSLSQTDVLVALYFKYLNIDPARPDWADRDRFILSKGHGGVGWASVLAARGYFDKALLKDFNKTGSPFGMHLDSLKVKGCDASTGSLGHGLAIGVGLAVGAKLQKKNYRTYVMMGDGELCEGTIWEAAILAGHHRLDNLTAFVDRNGLMIDGPTEKITTLEPIDEKFRAFGWEALTIDGHDFAAIGSAVEQAQSVSGKPCAIICKTVKGKCVGLMEGQAQWHYGGLNSDLRDEALKSVDTYYRALLG
ncbi:MAG: Transketolase 1 [Deltaproteobacteria bacterium ADurb.BinA179]|nr:transketolase [Deltaproteobacteria bacterium]MDI9541521.1 transketolase [Pseudomonadota bacterium]OPZ28439.1 MAG: Transketolase 1 [Deltaproteobacteria bacterium ADurb.BinA179]HOD71860.1 transketolase [Deltaproteobacteria bacterium]HON62671.1 transketolase [Deltaproteobacteria bacterium]